MEQTKTVTYLDIANAITNYGRAEREIGKAIIKSVTHAELEKLCADSLKSYSKSCDLIIEYSVNKMKEVVSEVVKEQANGN